MVVFPIYTSFLNHFIQASDGIERAQVTDVRQQLCYDSQRSVFMVPHIPLYMAFPLRFTAAGRNEHRKNCRIIKITVNLFAFHITPNIKDIFRKILLVYRQPALQNQAYHTGQCV